VRWKISTPHISLSPLPLCAKNFHSWWKFDKVLTQIIFYSFFRHGVQYTIISDVPRISSIDKFHSFSLPITFCPFAQNYPSPFYHITCFLPPSPIFGGRPPQSYGSRRTVPACVSSREYFEINSTVELRRVGGVKRTWRQS